MVIRMELLIVNDLGLATETNIASPNEETNNSSKVIDTLDVVIPKGAK